jgi:HEAT repeat protein
MLLILVALMTLAGCGPRVEAQRHHMPPRSARPPAVPPARQVPLDPALLEQARRVVEQSARHSDPYLRANAMEAVRLGMGPEHGQIVLRGLDDADPVVQFAAAMAAGEMRLHTAREPLQRLADEPDMHVRVATRFALHRLGDSSRSRDLAVTAEDPDPAVRANTALVLGLLEEPTAVRVLRPMRRDSSVLVRLQVAEALWRMRDPMALETLVTATISVYPDDQMVGVLALAAPRDRRVIEHVRGMLATDYEEVNLVAARAMGMLGSDEGHGVALRGAKSADARQRLLAALALGAIGRSDAQDVLRELLQDADPVVRLAAATGLLQLQWPHQVAPSEPSTI